MFAKKSQAQGAAVLIIIITLAILFYVLMLPPSDRADLLGEPSTVTLPETGQVAGTGNALPYNGKFTLLQETPGSIEYNSLDELEIPLNSFVLYKTVNSKVLEEFNAFSIKNGVGDIISQNLTFEIPDAANIDNLILTFTTKKHTGLLTIRLNGEQIYQFAIDKATPEPVKIKKSLLRNSNTLGFSVDGVGWQFWKTNEYSFEGVKLIGDVTDVSRQKGENTFFVSEEQGKNIDKATLKFNPDCKTGDVGKLTIRLNGRTAFSAIPDCGSLNFVDFAPDLIIIGKNSIDFSTDAGSYLLDLVKVQLAFKENQIPIYYFEADEGLFTPKVETKDYECGKKDGVCPKSCSEDMDYDCCMSQYSTPYWCVADTANENDKCVGFVTTDNMDRCPTGYVNKNGDVADDAEGKCGDNNDDKCPSGCQVFQDKDCCFKQSGDQYWCDFMPTNGLGSRCVNSVSLGQCSVCPVEYTGEDAAPICGPTKTGFEAQELKEGYGVVLNMKFTDNYQRKEADIYINGHLTRLDTTGELYQKDISAFAEAGTNSIEIVPFSSLNIREIKVDVVQ